MEPDTFVVEFGDTPEPTLLFSIFGHPFTDETVAFMVWFALIGFMIWCAVHAAWDHDRQQDGHDV